MCNRSEHLFGIWLHESSASLYLSLTVIHAAGDISLDFVVEWSQYWVVYFWKVMTKVLPETKISAKVANITKINFSKGWVTYYGIWVPCGTGRPPLIEYIKGCIWSTTDTMFLVYFWQHFCCNCILCTSNSNPMISMNESSVHCVQSWWVVTPLSWVALSSVS